MPLTFDPDYLEFEEQASAPATPSAGNWLLYAKAAGIFVKDDAGVETQLGTGGGFTNFDVAADSGTPATIDDGETLTIAGGTGLTSSVSGNTVTINFNGLSLTTETIQVWKLLNNTALGSTGSFDVDLSSGEALNCKHLMIKCLLRSSASVLSDDVYLTYNNDNTATNYYRLRLAATSSSPVVNFENLPKIATVNGSMAEANNFSHINIDISDFRNTSKEKIAYSEYGQYESTTNGRVGVVAHQWQNTNAITRIQIRTDNYPTAEFVSGSEIWVYGLKEISVVTNVTVS